MNAAQRESAMLAYRIELRERDDDSRYIQHHAKSVELIHHNAERGMSRRAMEKIWPYRLLNLVLGHEEPK